MRIFRTLFWVFVWVVLLPVAILIALTKTHDSRRKPISAS